MIINILEVVMKDNSHPSRHKQCRLCLIQLVRSFLNVQFGTIDVKHSLILHDR